jgi:accessory gene regulator protein AgrB
VRRAGRTIGIYLMVILMFVAAGYLYQSLGIGGVIALGVVLIAGMVMFLRRSRISS